MLLEPIYEHDFHDGSYHYERRREEQSSDNGNCVGEPGTYDLLGFTHYWGKTRKGGRAVKRKTMKSRLVRSVQKVDQWCRKNRHKPIHAQWKKLCEKVRGHYGYYGISGNSRSLGNFLCQVHRSWQRWLKRRNRNRSLTWASFNLLLERFTLPPPKIAHGVYLGK